MLGNLACFLLSADFLKIIFFFKNIFQEHYIRVSNHLDSDQDQHSVAPDLDPNCLQRLSTVSKTSGKALKGMQ